MSSNSSRKVNRKQIEADYKNMIDEMSVDVWDKIDSGIMVEQ